MSAASLPNIDASVLKSILNQAHQKTQPKPQPDQNAKLQADGNITIDIPAFQEWRFELLAKDKLKLKLLSGTAEIFGTELSPNMEYSFQGSMRSCISTFRGCKIQYWNCQPSSEYISEESCMKQYLNLHFALEKQRYQSKYANKQAKLVSSNTISKGPRVLIIGPKDSGKTSLSRILSSYAEKMDNQPLLINLNPRSSQFVIPGSLTATPISDMFNVENMSLGETITTGPSFYHQKQPIVETFGMEKYQDNVKLYRYLIHQLSKTVKTRFENDSRVAESGLIIDTPAFTISDHQLIQELINWFDINVLVVIGNERLLFDLKKKLYYPELELVKVNKSSGCVDKDDRFERELQQRSIKEYFYGIESLQLSPYTITLNLSDLIFLKPKEVEDVNMSFLGGDQDEDDNDTNSVENVSFNRLLERLKEPSSDNLANAILALADDSNVEINKYLNNLQPDETLIEAVLKSSTLGFCYVLHCDDAKKKIKLLIPSPVQQLPTKTLILTQYRYHE
ncbi:hypothetical protein CANARDRAFT_26008 [[Candida] arabinofermentans NRRL YB-2248]|uniref:Polynucleotide 5'-hydroxyl-kinase GRC3 n=1 Tax=[Candida] arabinofermentans NRRL YB-2248 TaxID=983967 RepID=A0A1E4T7T4_9ASCO|nr:hypothetical protein CANARDRAFT_26008 [[Candida] arabinofermentans NRRL YB-2248]